MGQKSGNHLVYFLDLIHNFPGTENLNC